MEDDKAGLRRIIEDDETWAEKPCRHPEHNPPMHIVLEPGTYEYTCPACGQVVRFTVPEVTCRV